MDRASGRTSVSRPEAPRAGPRATQSCGRRRRRRRTPTRPGASPPAPPRGTGARSSARSVAARPSPCEAKRKGAASALRTGRFAGRHDAKSAGERRRSRRAGAAGRELPVAVPTRTTRDGMAARARRASAGARAAGTRQAPRRRERTRLADAARRSPRTTPTVKGLFKRMRGAFRHARRRPSAPDSTFSRTSNHVRFSRKEQLRPPGVGACCARAARRGAAHAASGRRRRGEGSEGDVAPVTHRGARLSPPVPQLCAARRRPPPRLTASSPGSLPRAGQGAAGRRRRRRRRRRPRVRPGRWARRLPRRSELARRGALTPRRPVVLPAATHAPPAVRPPCGPWTG